MIRSLRAVLCRALVGVLADRHVTVFAVAEACRIPITDLRRLVEFGSALDHEAAERLIRWGMKMAVVAKPRKPHDADNVSINGRMRMPKPVTLTAGHAP
jgi:hypothetical protein